MAINIIFQTRRSTTLFLVLQYVCL